jgi:hypothetical protein
MVAVKPNFDSLLVAWSAKSRSLNFPISRYFSERMATLSTFEDSIRTAGRFAKIISGAGARETSAPKSGAAVKPIPGTGGLSAAELTAGVKETGAFGAEREGAAEFVASSLTTGGLAAGDGAVGARFSGG